QHEHRDLCRRGRPTSPARPEPQIQRTYHAPLRPSGVTWRALPPNARAGGRVRLQVRPPRSGYSVAPGAVLPGRGEPGRGRAAPGFGHSRARDAPDVVCAAGQVPVAALTAVRLAPRPR